MIKSFLSVFLLFVSLNAAFSQTPASEPQKVEQPGIFSVWWGNFVSYFNVYYNATRLYDRTIQLFYEDNLKNGSEISTVFPVFKKGSTGRAELQKVSSKAITIVQNHPESDLADNALLLVGKAYFYMGDLSPAERKFREVISNYTNPDVVFEATLFLARAFLEQNKNEEALSLVQDLIKRTDVPDQVKGEANMMLGERYYLAGQVETAIPLFIEGIRLYDDQEAAARASYLIGKALMLKQQYPEAIIYFADAKKVSTLPAVWYWSGVRSIECMIQTGKLNDAQNYLEAMLDDDELAGFFSQLQIEQARIFKALKKWDQARLAYIDFIQNNSGSLILASGWYELAQLTLEQQKDLELSRYYFEKASQATQPDSVVLKAKNKEAELKSYLELSYELRDLNRLVNLGIVKKKTVLPDSLRKTIPDSLKIQNPDSVKTLASDSSAQETSPELADVTSDQTPEDFQQPVLPQSFPQMPQNQPSQFNMQGDADNQMPQMENQFPQNDNGFSQTDSDFGIPQQSQMYQGGQSGANRGNQTGAKTNPFAESVYSKTFISAKYKSKYIQAIDSMSFRKLLDSYEQLAEKKIEHFYFISQQMDSVVQSADFFASRFPASKRIPRVLYAKSAALVEMNKNEDSNMELKKLAIQYPATPYGVEAKKRLSIPDSLGLLQLSVEASFQKVINWIETGRGDSAKIVLNGLLKMDSTFTVYPRVLYAKGYVAEKFDRNWAEAFKWYSKIVTSFPNHPITKALISQIDFGSLSGTQKPAATDTPANKGKEKTPEEVAQNGTTADQGQVAIKGKREEMKFVITPNLPPRFKRQPKISQTW